MTSRSGVLHVHKVSGVSGSERHLSILLPALRRCGWDAQVLLLPVGDGERAVEMFRGLDVPVHTLPPGPDANPLLVARIARMARELRPAIVHTHLIHADVHGQVAARLGRVPGVTSLHATHDFNTRAPYRQAARLAGRLASRTIAISHHVARFASSHGLAPADQLRVVHYGIPADPWLNPSRDRGTERRRLGFDDADIVVGVASRIVAGKGHTRLLDAFARARQQVPSLRLAIAGDGALRTEAEDHAGRLGLDESVRFLGFLDDIPSFLSACDMAAFPTLPTFGEGFGLAALEAMAAGVPLIASGLDSLPEIVEHDETGLLVPPGDHDAWSEAIVRLASDPDARAALGRAGRRRATEEFSVDAMVRATESVYREVLGS